MNKITEDSNRLNLIKELENNKTILLLLSNDQYNDSFLNIAKQLSKKRLCYISLNKTYPSLEESFVKVKATFRNMIFIDAISKTINLKTPNKTDNCYYISSPRALTELSIRITEILKGEIDYLIFDSFTNILTYQKGRPVSNFISFILNKIRTSGTKAIFYAIPISEQESFIKEIGMYFDKVIDLSR